MKYILKLLFLFQTLYHLLILDFVFEELLVLLLIVTVYFLKERFWDNAWSLALLLIIVTLAVSFAMPFGLLYAMLAYDFTYKRIYIGTIAAISLLTAHSPLSELPLILLLTGACIFLGVVLAKWESRYHDYCRTLDEERHLRYSLEQARNKLLASARETAHLAEVKERNRIAREIHDSVGHSIAGVLVQLQVAQKLVGQNDEKARATLELCTGKLSEALTVTRETVYNLKPREKLGIDYIKKIVDDYTFCPIDAAYEGDIENMPSEHMEVTASIVKEALTNTAKYSKATHVAITLQANEKYSRLMVQDNGVGCDTIREGLGISGMKERVANLGGNLSITSDNGFMIVCVLYR